MPAVLIDALRQAFWGTLPTLGSLTLLDYLGLITLGIFALDGLRRGFLLGTLDLVALTLTLGAAISLYPVIGGALGDYLDVYGPFGNVIAFALVFALGEALYLVGAHIVRGLTVPFFRAVPPIGALNALAGAAPGFVKGAAAIALLAAAFRALPMAPELKGIFDRSVVVSRTGPIAAAVAPDLPALLGRLGLESVVLAPPPQSPGTPQGRKLQFPPGLRSEPDPAGERLMLEYVNRERVAAGVGALVMDDRLLDAARKHSQEMFDQSYFAHDSPVAGSPFDRMQRAGARFTTAGENLAYAPTVEAVHRGLMNSPLHRKNILNPDFKRVGIGIVKSNAWGRMVTQNFTD